MCPVIIMSDIGATLGDRIRHLRTERKLSQLDLANRVGVRQSAISAFETGEKSPRLDTLQRIASALGVSTAVLIVPEEGQAS